MPAPTINQQPDSQAICDEGTAVFSITVTSEPPVTYQWSHNGVDLVNGGNVSGATSSSLTIHPVGFADAGSYRVRVSNPGGSTDSDSVTLTVFAGGSGDANGDGLFNGGDIAGFIQTIIEGAVPSAGACACDMTHDGTPNLDDLPEFVSSLVDS